MKRLPHKSAPSKDLSYRPPRSAKVEEAKTGSFDISSLPENGDKVPVDRLAQDHVSDSV